MKTTSHPTPSQLTDEHTLEAATSRFSNPIPIYDDGWGELYIHRNSLGISGIVRALSWEYAYSICEDEFFPKVTAEEEAEFEKDYSRTYLSGRALWLHDHGNDYEAWRALTEDERGAACGKGRDVPFDSTKGQYVDHPCWQESYGFCPNGGIYHKDVNGDYLDVLTDALALELEITLVASIEIEEEAPTQFHHWHSRRHSIPGTRLCFVSQSGNYGASPFYPGCRHAFFNTRRNATHRFY